MRPLLIALVLWTTTAAASAQEGQTGSISGTVRDDSGAVLANAVVTASSPQLIGGPQLVRTDAMGRYKFSTLLPGTYEIVTSLQGFKTLHHSGIELPPGLGLTVDAPLQIAPVAEAVKVDAAVPTIDIHSAAAPVALDRQFVEHLPLDRSAAGYVNLAPGIFNGVAFGGSQQANTLTVDGTSGNDPDWGTPYAAPNANWFDGIQIVSLGASAQYGEYVGARINAITRSGSNRYSGLSDLWTTHSGWTGNNRGDLRPDLAQRFKPIEVLTRWDTSQQLGGPIARDRVWFFAGLEYYRNEQRPFSFANVARSPEEPVATTVEPKALFKMTALLLPGVRIEGFAEYDNSKSTNGNAGPLVRPDALGSGQTPEYMTNLRLTAVLGSSTLFEAHVGTFRADNSYGPTPPNSRSGPPGHYDQFTNVSSVNVTYYSDKRPHSATVSGSLTHTIDGVAGRSHEFKLGFEYEQGGLYEASGYPGGLYYLDYNGAPDTAKIWAGSIHDTSYHRTSAFAQDTWIISDQLTIEPGVRTGSYYGIASNTPGAQPYANVSISPRVGAAWDVAADHRTVLRVHYGWYAAPMVTSFYDIFDYTLNNAPTIVAKVIEPNQFQEIRRSGGPASLAGLGIDPEAKHPYTEEYIAGIERELWPRTSLRAQYIRRSPKNALGWVDKGSVWTPMSVVDPGPDGVQSTRDDGGPMTVYSRDHPEQAFPVLSNPSNAWQHYNAFQVIGTRRYAAGGELQASYTWSRAVGSYDSVFSTSAAQGELSTNGIAANPNWNLFRTGRNIQDRTHEMKALATYALPYWGGFRVSGIYRYVSGTPWARVAYFGPQTNLCCLGPRVEPAIHKLAATNTADLRVEKPFRLSTEKSVAAYFDIFNIVNQGIAQNINFQSGPNFAVPLSWSDPRTVRAGVRFTF